MTINDRLFTFKYTITLLYDRITYFKENTQFYIIFYDYLSSYNFAIAYSCKLKFTGISQFLLIIKLVLKKQKFFKVQ